MRQNAAKHAWKINCLAVSKSNTRSLFLQQCSTSQSVSVLTSIYLRFLRCVHASCSQKACKDLQGLPHELKVASHGLENFFMLGLQTIDALCLQSIFFDVLSTCGKHRPMTPKSVEYLTVSEYSLTFIRDLHSLRKNQITQSLTKECLTRCWILIFFYHDRIQEVINTRRGHPVLALMRGKTETYLHRLFDKRLGFVIL